MPIKEYWDFVDEGSVPAAFTELEGGSGAVSITSDHLRIDNGGTASGDYAAAVYQTKLDSAKLTIVYGECKFSGNTGAWVPNLVGVFDSASEPVAMSESARNSAWRIGKEYQLSTSGDENDRVTLKMKNESDSARWYYVASTNTWQASSAHTRDFFDEGSYYRFVIVFDGTTSPKRLRSLVYGVTNDINIIGIDIGGWELNYDSEWVDLTTGSGNCDPIDNDLWVVFGDPINAHASRSEQVIFDFRRIMIGEIDTANLDEVAWSNRSDATGANTSYIIVQRLNPMPNAQTCWIGREKLQTDIHTIDVARGSDVRVKDPYVYYDGTNYWMFYQREITGGGQSGKINVRSTTDILNTSWSSDTIISTPVTGEAKHSFPWATKKDGTWYLFYGVEPDTDPDFVIQYKTSSASDPTSGWSSATEILAEGAASDWDEHGVSQPIMIWHSGTFTGGVWYMQFAGLTDANVWKGGLAKSTTGITGTYTKEGSNPNMGSVTTASDVNGAVADSPTIVVDSTTGWNAGQWLIHGNGGGDPRKHIEVLTIDSGTQFTASIEMTLADGNTLTTIENKSVVPRFLRRINGFWVCYVTLFKYASGNEITSIYIDTTGNTALEDCTFRQLRYGDSPIDFVFPIWNSDMASDENTGGAFSELLSPVIGGTVGRMYSVSNSVAGVTTAIDLLRISAPADAVIVVHKIIVTQETEFGDAASEQMDIQFHRGSTDGSGGATPTARPLEVGDAAFGGTVATGNTTQSTEGVILHVEAANVMAGFVYPPTPEERIVLSPSGRLIVELPTVPDDSIDFRVVAIFEEIGG